MKKGWIVLLGAAAAISLYIATPYLLRHVGFFRVRKVELIGVKYLSPDSLLAALALTPDQNVFDDRAAIARRAEGLAGVVSARVDRKLPGTLRVSVIERVPVAFAPGPDRLVALDGEGRPLPYNAAATGLDLPVIARADSQLVRTLAVVQFADSALFREVDGARVATRGITLELGERRVLLPGVPASDEVRALGAVRRHLASTGRNFQELDTRYEGWIVVRRSTT
jgi:cell division protein FtsQ